MTRPTASGSGRPAALLRTARRPVLYVGGGVTKAGAEAALRDWPRWPRAPVTTTP